MGDDQGRGTREQDPGDPGNPIFLDMRTQEHGKTAPLAPQHFITDGRHCHTLGPSDPKVNRSHKSKKRASEVVTLVSAMFKVHLV